MGIDEVLNFVQRYKDTPMRLMTQTQTSIWWLAKRGSTRCY